MDIARLAGTVSVAIMSISVVTYALAVPRLQTALSLSLRTIKESKAKLERRMKEEQLTLQEIEDQLKAIGEEQREMNKVVVRLSWSRVVFVPVVLAFFAIGIVAVLLVYPSFYPLPLLIVSTALVLGAFAHLLDSLRLIEQTTVRPELSVEGWSS
jgi:acyl-CoA synthetase (AMP-forming)/AMP-acid ligase II